VAGSAPAAGLTTGGEDVVRVVATTPGEPDADVVYVGERAVDLLVQFGQDCQNWSVDLRSPLFLTWLRGVTCEEVKAGEGHHHWVELDPEAEPGTYDLTVHLNYSTDEGPVNSSYDFQLKLVRAWGVVDVHTPDGDDHHLSVTFETFVPFHNVTVLFGGDGDVGVADERLVLEDVKPGEHTVSTTVVEVESWPGNAQEISWDLTGVVDNRTLQKAEYNVHVDVSWGDAPGFGAPLVLMAVLVALGARRGRRR
jgi:hypothetical protein